VEKRLLMVGCRSSENRFYFSFLLSFSLEDSHLIEKEKKSSFRR